MKVGSKQNICIWLTTLLMVWLGLNDAVPIRLDRRDRYELARSGAVVFADADVNDWQVPVGGSKEFEFRVYEPDEARHFSQVLSMCRLGLAPFFDDYRYRFNGTLADTESVALLPAEASSFYDNQWHSATLPLSVVFLNSPPFDQAQDYLGYLVDEYAKKRHDYPQAFAFAAFGCCRMEVPIACKTAAWLISQKGVTEIGSDPAAALVFEKWLWKRAEELASETEENPIM